MKSNFYVSFIPRKNQPMKDGSLPLIVRITINSENVRFNSKLSVNPDLWDSKLNRATGKSLEATSLNRKLDSLKTKIINLYNDLILADGYTTPERIKNKLLGIEKDYRNLIEYFSMHNEQYVLKVGKGTSHKTFTRYELTKSRLVEYLKKYYSSNDISIKELDLKFVEGFYLYLRNECECNNNTAMKFVQRLRKIFIYAKSTGIAVNDPFISFKFHYDHVDREILNQKEIDILINKDLSSKRLGVVRDIFIFSCYTGLSYIDLANLTDSNIMIDEKGNYWVKTKRQKTNNKSDILLLDTARSILLKYYDQRKNENVFPVVSNQKGNEYLKEIAIICNINKTLTFHIARHAIFSFDMNTSKLQ